MNDGFLSAHSRGSSMPQLVEKACQHWEARRQAAAAQQDRIPPPPPAFTIALSREMGTDGTAVAQEVGRLLGWHVYDHELLEHIAKEMGLRTALLESLDEKNQNWLLEVVETFASIPTKSEFGEFVTESEYVHHLIQTVLALGVHGECVIVGRGAAFILPAATTLRVRLVGPVRERVKTLSHKLGLSEAEAARQVRTTDRERNDYVQDHFLKDPTDPRNYDLVVNVSSLTKVQIAGLIVDALRRRQSCGTDNIAGHA